MNAAEAKRARFRELLNSPGIIPTAVAYDCLSARIFEQAGFELLGMGGNSTMASLIGYPDLSLATGTEMYARAKQIATRTSAPLYCDADTGYGDLYNVRRTVEEYELAGAAGIHLEDQTFPKKCGNMPGVTVIPAEQAVEKVKVALKSRTDPNFIIIARTDSYNSLGIEESIRRCRMFYEAGADVVMPEGMQTREEWAYVGQELSKDGIPAMIDLIYADHVKWTNKECEDMGFKIVSRGMYPITALTKFLKDFAADMHDNNCEKYVDQCISIRDYEKVLGIERELNIRDLLI